MEKDEKEISKMWERWNDCDNEESEKWKTQFARNYPSPKKPMIENETNY